ncbi:hypothetical protein Tco_0345410 [Tanacetum coccineum]
MMAYLEKTDGNTEFHQIMDFLTRSSIYHALTGKNFSWKVTPLFDSMLVQQTVDEGDASERPSESPPIPSPPHLSEDQPQTQSAPSPSIAVPDPEGSGEHHGGQSSNDASLSGNEDGSGQEAKERSQTTYHTSQILDKECCSKDKIGKEDFSEEKELKTDLQCKEKDGYDTWQSRMLLYVEGKENREMLLDSILNGSFEYKVVTFSANEAMGIPAETWMVKEANGKELSSPSKTKSPTIGI